MTGSSPRPGEYESFMTILQSSAAKGGRRGRVCNHNTAKIHWQNLGQYLNYTLPGDARDSYTTCKGAI